MSSENLKTVLHSSNVLMRPLTRAFAIGVAAWVGYLLFTPSKFVQRIPPNYEEYRRLKGLPDVPLKHPAFAVKEMRIIPKDEEINRDRP